MNLAVAEINKQLAERNFMAATMSAYNFWLYELCDVYIVRPLPHLPRLRPPFPPHCLLTPKLVLTMDCRRR